VDIQKFTNQLLTVADFFADYGRPVTQHHPKATGWPPPQTFTRNSNGCDMSGVV
jgi:hypothetical protein